MEHYALASLRERKIIRLSTQCTPYVCNAILQSPEEREYSSMMQTALEAAVQLSSFPKAVVDVYCLVLEAGGAELAVAITAASLALADAGIEMRDLVTACSVVGIVFSCSFFWESLVGREMS